MPVKSISTIQAKTPLGASAFLQLSTGGCVIFDIEGNITSTTGTNYYIQLLTTNQPLSGTTIPIYSRLAVPAGYASGINGFSFVYRPEGLDTATMMNPVGGTGIFDGRNPGPVWLAISTTDGVYTSTAATGNVTVDIEDQSLDIPQQFIVGSLTGGNNTGLVVWNDPNTSGSRLLKVQAFTQDGVDRWLTINASPFMPDMGAVLFGPWKLPANGFLVTLNFGKGLQPISRDPVNGNLYTGCMLVVSMQPDKVHISTGTAKIKAWYA